ncbi:MAG: hypothetical protein FJ087_16520 [Deltaproteobacteria bacterium]|nr:hypothetical protein [Deltaproteobacteria bacterium]
MNRIVAFMVVLPMACLACSSGDKSGRGSPAARVEDALKRFAADLNAGDPAMGELERALAARLTDAAAEIIARQYLHMVEAASRHESLPLDPEFLALALELSDLPYFNEFAYALAAVNDEAPPGYPGALARRTSSLTTAPSCAKNCALDALPDYFVSQGATVLGLFSPQFDAVASGIGCTDQTREMYDCVANHRCNRASIGDLAISCYGTLGSALGLGGAVGAAATAPWLAGAVIVMGAFAGALNARMQVEDAVRECEEYQEANCCIGKVKCGTACCEQGFGCLAGGLCARNATPGCAAGETRCGIWCCAAGQDCGDDGTCHLPPVCLEGTKACGSSCCTERQRCDFDGVCHECTGASLCGGTVCCLGGRFCNAVGQCLPEPSGGCGSVCGTSCCAPGQACSGTDCVGDAASCPDGVCTPGVETPMVCPADCRTSVCGDGRCEKGEDPGCPADCGSGGSGVWSCDMVEKYDTCHETAGCSEADLAYSAELCDDGIWSQARCPTAGRLGHCSYGAIWGCDKAKVTISYYSDFKVKTNKDSCKASGHGTWYDN